MLELHLLHDGDLEALTLTLAQRNRPSPLETLDAAHERFAKTEAHGLEAAPVILSDVERSRRILEHLQAGRLRRATRRMAFAMARALEC